MAQGIDRAAVERYDKLVAAARPADLETVEVGAGLFGRARIVRPSREEMAHDEEYEVVVAGGGPAGMLYGSILSQLCARDVLVLERKRARDYNCTWNVAHEELEEFGQAGIFGPEEVKKLVRGRSVEGIFRIYCPSRSERFAEFRFDDIYNLALDETFFFNVLEKSGLEVRYGTEARLKRLTRKWAYVCAGERIVRAKLFVDARGWTSPLSLLVNAGSGRRGFFNVVGLRTSALNPPLPGNRRSIICATYSDEEQIGREVVQPVVERFPDYGQGTAEEVLYLYTRTARPASLRTLLRGSARYARLTAPGFREEMVKHIYYGHIPVYHESCAPFQRSAGPRTLLIGDAGNYLSGLTGCGFAAIARNARRVPFEIDDALRRDDLSFERLNRINIDPREQASQTIESLFDMVMAFQKHERLGAVNRDWLSVLLLAERMEPRLKNWCLRDKVTLRALHSLLWASLEDTSALEAILRNARWRVWRVAALFLSGYLRLLAAECSLAVRRRRLKYFAAAACAALRLPTYALGSSLFCAKGLRRGLGGK